MILTLEVVGEQAEDLGASGRKVFHAVGGTIGRLPDNDWVFPDPYVSGRHALIRYLTGKFFVEDTSTNGVYLNSPDNRLPKAQPHVLKDGDLLYIDAYRINVSIQGEAENDFVDTMTILKDAAAKRPAPAAPVIPKPVAVAPPPKPEVAHPEPVARSPAPQRPARKAPPPPDETVFTPSQDDQTVGMQAAVDENKTEWIGLPKTPAVDTHKTEWIGAPQAPVAASKAAAPRAVPPSAAADPHKTEWLGAPKSGAADPHKTEWMGAPKTPVADPHKTEWVGSASKAPVPVDENKTEWIGIPNTPAGDNNKTEWFGPKAVDVAAPVADSKPRVTPARPAAATAPASAPAPVARAAAPVEPVPAAPPPKAAALPAAPQPVATPAAAAPERSTPRERIPAREPPRAGGGGRSDDAMMREVLAAAGIEGVEPTPELAKTIGEILRIAVGGMMEVQRARERMKDELRVRGTIFKPAHNNPLKFSANVEDAFHNLLLKHNAAYLDPTRAFEDAFHDVRDHHSAILTALRLAFESMLAQFDPARMQDEFDRQMKKGSILGVPVKLRYWELYRDRYGDMVKDADTSFRHLFGDKFAVEYEEQLERLKSQGRDREK